VRSAEGSEHRAAGGRISRHVGIEERCTRGERRMGPKAKGIGQRFTLKTVEKTNRLFAGVTIDPMAGRFTK
jgi:hypothetical protein